MIAKIYSNEHLIFSVKADRIVMASTITGEPTHRVVDNGKIVAVVPITLTVLLVYDSPTEDNSDKMPSNHGAETTKTKLNSV